MYPYVGLEVRGGGGGGGGLADSNKEAARVGWRGRSGIVAKSLHPTFNYHAEVSHRFLVHEFDMVWEAALCVQLYLSGMHGSYHLR